MDELIEAIHDLRAIQKEIGHHGVKDPLNGFIPESQAMEILERGSTWFWQKRKSQELIGIKAAGRWYYRLTEIQNFIKNGNNN